MASMFEASSRVQGHEPRSMSCHKLTTDRPTYAHLMCPRVLVGVGDNRGSNQQRMTTASGRSAQLKWTKLCREVGRDVNSRHEVR